MTAQETVKEFLEDRMDVKEFKRLCDADDAIYDFLQGIIDKIRAEHGTIDPYPFVDEEGLYGVPGRIVPRTAQVHYLLDPASDPGLQYCPPQYESVRQMLNYNFRMITHNVNSADGAHVFYEQVLVIYYQFDKTVRYTNRYWKAFTFSLDVIPEYLSGGDAEGYIQEHIIPLFPESMGKTKRVKAIKAKIKEEFKSEKGYPAWIQSCDWPLGKDGKPCTYVKKGKKPNPESERWIFRDETDGELITVEQYY